MAKAMNGNKVHAAPLPGAARGRDWGRRMSDNIAWALLVYTALQIFVTVNALKGEGGSLLPYMALVVLVAGIIPACRWFERRWENIPAESADSPVLQQRFRRDRLWLWASAVGLPFLLTGLFRVLAAIG